MKNLPDFGSDLQHHLFYLTFNGKLFTCPAKKFDRVLDVVSRAVDSGGNLLLKALQTLKDSIFEEPRPQILPYFDCSSFARVHIHLASLTPRPCREREQEYGQLILVSDNRVNGGWLGLMTAADEHPEAKVDFFELVKLIH